MLKWGDVYQDHDTGQVCKYFPCHKGQVEVLQSPARYVAALGGKNGGKTSVAMLWLLQEIQRYGGKGQFLVVAPTYNVALSATLDCWRKTCKGTDLQGEFIASTNNPHYKLGTGGIIFFRSADANYEGVKPQAIVIDEAGNISEDQWRVVLGRIVGQVGGRIFLSTTPYLAHDWLNRLILQKADAGDKNYFYRTFPSWLNPTTDVEAVEHYRQTLPPWQFDMEYRGLFTRMPGLVYDFTTADGESCFVDVPSGGLPDAAGYFAAIDFGGTDPHCWLVGLLDTSGQLWIVAEHYKSGDILSLFESIKEWHDAFEKATGTRVKTWYCDHQKSAILALRKMGFPAKPALKGPESIPLGISLVQSRIRTGRLKVLSNQCPNIKAESLLYRYPMADGMPVGNKPIDADNHALDALRYLILGIDRRQVGRQLKKAG